MVLLELGVRLHPSVLLGVVRIALEPLGLLGVLRAQVHRLDLELFHHNVLSAIPVSYWGEIAEPDPIIADRFCDWR